MVICLKCVVLGCSYQTYELTVLKSDTTKATSVYGHQQNMLFVHLEDDHGMPYEVAEKLAEVKLDSKSSEDRKSSERIDKAVLLSKNMYKSSEAEAPTFSACPKIKPSLVHGRRPGNKTVFLFSRAGQKSINKTGFLAPK